MEKKMIKGRHVSLTSIEVNDPSLPLTRSLSEGFALSQEGNKKQDGSPYSLDEYVFDINRLKDDYVLGFIGLDGHERNEGLAWISLESSDETPALRVCLTEAMQLLLKFAFVVLNLNRVNLNLLSVNEKAIDLEECGFRYEGTQREVMYRDSRHWDVIDLGILRSEWELNQQVVPLEA